MQIKKRQNKESVFADASAKTLSLYLTLFVGNGGEFTPFFAFFFYPGHIADREGHESPRTKGSFLPRGKCGRAFW